MTQEEILRALAEAVVDGDEDIVAKLTSQAIDKGIKPLDIINEGLTKGIDIVGQNFGAGTFFLPDLLLGAKSMEVGIKILEPFLEGTNREFLGKVLIGTVEGDLHEIGKNIVIMMLKTSGFEVYDLGVDVPAKIFIEKAKEYQADIIGISALLTTTVGRQKEIIELLAAEGIRQSVKVIIGGAPINQAWADKIGADGYAEDATVAVEVAKRFMGIN